jgi:hypothetical protein
MSADLKLSIYGLFLVIALHSIWIVYEIRQTRKMIEQEIDGLHERLRRIENAVTGFDSN